MIVWPTALLAAVLGARLTSATCKRVAASSNILPSSDIYSPSSATPSSSISSAIYSTDSTSSTSPSTASSIITSTSTSSTVSLTSVGQDFTLTYTYTDYTLPAFSTLPESSQGPANTDVPQAPAPSEVCVIDPDNASDTFSLMAPDFSYLVAGAGVVREVQDADLPSDVATNGYTPPSWVFTKSGTSGVYNLMVNDTSRGVFLYVGLDTTNGNVVTANASSSAGRVLTSIFSITCGGQINVTVNGNAYIWQVASDGVNTVMAPGLQDKTNTMIANPATTLAQADTLRRRLKRALNLGETAYQTGSDPRCPYSPGGLKAVAAPGARPPEHNGCGSGSTSKLVPQLVFGSCCDNHDLCFDNCEGGWFSPCNHDFYNCMSSSCSSHYPWYLHPLDRTKCEAAALLYWGVVSSFLGEIAFYDANFYDASKPREKTGRCVCTCSQGSYCNGQCVDYSNDNSNCGGCGIHCTGTNVCRNGRCACPYDTQNDHNNCGSCGIACPSWSVCRSGQCGCPANQCGNLCVDFQNHPNNCGACGNVCSSGYCNQGHCLTPPAEVCNPGNVISNGNFDGTDPSAYWTATGGAAGAGFDGGANTYPNSMAITVRNSAVILAQNIALCPGARYQLTFYVRNIDISSSTCYWSAWAAGKQLGSGTINNARATDFIGIGPLYLNPLPRGTGSGSPGSATYQIYQYDASGIRAYSQLAIILTCSNSNPNIVRVDSVSFFQG